MSLDDRLASLKDRAALKTSLAATPQAFLCEAWETLRVAVINFISNNDLLWASGITYTVTLSIIPVLALAFSVLKGLGGAERLRMIIDRYLALGASQVTTHVMNYVNNVNAATLGSVGGVALLLTVVSTLGTIEQAFNAIWQVPVGRSYLRRFADYLSVIFTVPLLLAAALTLTATYSTKIHMVPGLALAVPFVMVWAGFLFLFVFFPYTTVNWIPALIGSLVSALLFQIAQWGYVYFQVGVASYRAIYGALATIPVVLVWIYVSWIIILFGVELTFAAQYGRTRTPETLRTPDFSRYATLLGLLRVAERFRNRGQLVTAQTLAAELGLSGAEMEPIIRRLKQTGLVIEARDNGGKGGAATGLFLSVDPSMIRLGDMLRTLEAGKTAARGDPRIDALLALVGEMEAARLDSLTLGDLRDGLVGAERPGPAAPEPSPPAPPSR